MINVSRTLKLPATVTVSRKRYLTSTEKASQARIAFLAQVDSFVQQKALPLLTKTFDSFDYAQKLQGILISLGLSIDRLILVSPQRLEQSGLPSGGKLNLNERKFSLPSLEGNRDNCFVIQERISLGLTSSDDDCLLSIAGKDPDRIIGYLAGPLLDKGIKQAMQNWSRLSNP